MEKQITKFNISSNITKGNAKYLCICPNCQRKIIIDNKYKLTYQKIKTIICSKCHYVIKIGDIFNFKTGTKLNNRNKYYNQNELDNHIWNDNYDKI